MAPNQHHRPPSRRAWKRIQKIYTAVDLDPFSTFGNLNLVLAYFFARDYTHGLEQGKKVAASDPNSAVALYWLGRTYELMGNYSQAIEQWKRNAIVNGDAEYAKNIERVFEASGYTGYLKLDAKYCETRGDFNGAALDYAQLGEKQATFAALERGFVTRKDLLFIKVDPAFDSVRSDPRYANLLRRIGLPQ